MTVSNATFRSPWVAANGANKVWNYSFFLAQQSHVVMQVRNNTTGVITEYTSDLTLIKTTDITGTVTFPVSAPAIASGNSVRVVRRVPYTQDVAIGNEGAFDPELHETAFDTMETQIQQLSDAASRSLQVPDGNPGGVQQAGVPVDRIWASDGANGLKDSGWTITTIASNVSAAAASASAAAASQTAAAASATAASGSQTAAATSATNAATSEANALSYRNTTNGYMTTTQGYRDTTQGYMNSASTYATNAATSATNASTANTNAQNALTAALAAQAAAESARDSTLAAYDSFDDRYLGAKAADPALDNDGNALVGGSLYFNTTTGAMKVYVTGTGWTAAYISPTGVPLIANAGSDYDANAFRTNLSLYTKAQVDAAVGAKADANNTTLTGTTATPDSADADNTSKIANTKFVQRAITLLKAAANTWSALQTFSAGVASNMFTANTTVGQAIGVSGAPAAGSPGMTVNTVNGAGNASFISFNRNAAFAGNFGIDTDNFWKVGGWSHGANAYKLLHEGLATGTFTGAYTWSGAQTFGADITVKGVTSTTIDDGTKSSGTYTPSPAGGNYRKIVNNGAFTLAAPSAAGSYNMEIDITNGATAGAITWSGFITGFPKGDALSTVNAKVFKVHISKTTAGVTAVVEAL